MKQFTTPEQTAKLIELGFATPRIDSGVTKWEGYDPVCTGSYSIGELIEMLPLKIRGDFGIWYYITFLAYETYWRVAYTDDNEIPLVDNESKDLIDALYGMIVKLKDEGNI